MRESGLEREVTGPRCISDSHASAPLRAGVWSFGGKGVQAGCHQKGGMGMICLMRDRDVEKRCDRLIEVRIGRESKRRRDWDDYDYQ